MIHSVLIVNDVGKPRLVRFYDHTPLNKQSSLVQEIFSLLRVRNKEDSCFVPWKTSEFSGQLKIIYRHFASLYFVMVVDTAESELAILDLIQVLVQVLDSCFENVCELDLIYHFDKLHYILDELVIGGSVLESNLDSITNAIRETSLIK